MLKIIKLNFKINFIPSKIGVKSPIKKRPGPTRFWKVAIILRSNKDINPEKIIIKSKKIIKIINMSHINIFKWVFCFGGLVESWSFFFWGVFWIVGGFGFCFGKNGEAVGLK